MDGLAGKEKGNLHPVQSLYGAHYHWLRQWLGARVGASADAEDLAQDTFVRVLMAHARAQLQLREPRAYLATVAGRLVANFYRRKSIEQSYLDFLAGLPQGQVPSLEDQALMKEALLEADQLLQGLGPRTRLCFLMAQLENLSYAQIAQRLGVSLRTVKYDVARAMAHCCATLSW